MKRTIVVLATIIVVFVAVFAVLVLRPVRKVKATSICSAAMLNGYYTWGEFGTEFEVPFTLPPHPALSWTQAGFVNFDGIGTVAGSDMYYIENGVASGPFTTTGTYTVGGTEPACTVTITYTWEKATYTDHGVIILDAPSVGSEVIAVEQSSKKYTTGNVDIKRVAGPT